MFVGLNRYFHHYSIGLFHVLYLLLNLILHHSILYYSCQEYFNSCHLKIEIGLS